MMIDASTPGAAAPNGPAVSSFNRKDTLNYLKDLIARFGKSLGIKSPDQSPAPPTNPLGPVQGPAQKPQ